MSRVRVGLVMRSAECSIRLPLRRPHPKEFGRMKRQITTAILTLAALVALAAIPATLFAQGAAGKPKAVAVEPIADVGSVAKGDSVSHDFVIKNEGTAPLELTRVEPACGCTVAKFDKTIAPGQSGMVHTVIDSSTFNGP